MASLHIPKGVRRVLFRTLNTDRKLMWKKEFDTSYVGFMKDGAQWLVDNTDIKLVGRLGPFLLEGHSWSSNNLSIDLFF
jgi:kynurenine formamidase